MEIEPRPSAGKISFTQALRLTFSYEGLHVRLLKQRSIKMVVPPSDPVRYEHDAVGFWSEVRDAHGGVLYRQLMQPPIRFDVEVVSEDPGDGESALARVAVAEDQRKGRFVLLIPDLVEARTLVLFSSPLEFGQPLAPAQELARFDLSETEDEP